MKKSKLTRKFRKYLKNQLKNAYDPFGESRVKIKRRNRRRERDIKISRLNRYDFDIT